MVLPRITPITSTTKINSRPIVALKLPRSATALVSLANVILQKMTNNPSFPKPTPTLAVIQTAVTTLQTAETAARGGTKGMATARDEQRAPLVLLLQQLGSFIQTTADASGDSAASIIESAGVSVRKTSTRQARVFAARQGAVSGEAMLVAPSAGASSSYEWMYSLDGGKTWVLAAPTFQARTSITGLPTATVVELKYRAVTRAGAGDWSAVVTLVVR
jgi:hypothetical protein